MRLSGCPVDSSPEELMLGNTLEPERIIIITFDAMWAEFWVAKPSHCVRDRVLMGRQECSNSGPATEYVRIA